MSDDERIQSLRALAAQKNRPLHWYGLAMALRQSGDHDEALGIFHRIHELDPHYVPAWFMRAQLHEERGEWRDAHEALRRGIFVAEQVGDAHAAGEMQAMKDSLPE